jgi:putative sporulation protein YtaF
VGITYGTKGMKIPFFSFLVILIFSVFYAAVSVLFGGCLKTLMDLNSIKIFGVALLSGLGINMIVKSFHKGKAEQNSERETELMDVVDMRVQVFQNPKVGDTDNSGVIEVKEAFFLTLALSVDSLVAGVAGGMFSFSVWLFPVVTGLLQTLFFGLGIVFGKLFKDKIRLRDKYVSILAGSAILVLSFIKLL